MKPIPYRMQGLSLIELMIAILIGLFLTMGLIQVFSASREAYRLSEGIARVQENGRFAMDYLQRDIRMAGHFGCVNDQARLQSSDILQSHTTGNLDFNVSIRGYDSVPTGLTLLPAPIAGSDLLVLRFLTSDGLPITAIDTDAGTVAVNAASWNVLTQSGVANPVLFGIADCAYADVFQADEVATASGIVTVTLPDTVLLDRYGINPEGGPATLYRAEAIVYYIGAGTGGQPSLYRARLGATSNTSEELVEGIENLQFLYGSDSSAAGALPTGYIARQGTASDIGAATADWRMVGQVELALLAASPNPASSIQAEEDTSRAPNLLGTTPTIPDDRRYRTVYQSTIALRNRLYGN